MKKFLPIVALLVVIVLSLTACTGALQDRIEQLPGGSVPNEGGDNFNKIYENPFVDTSVTPEAYFRLNANRASYNWIKRSINEGNANISPNSVRMEDLINAFDYSYQAPDKGLAMGSSMIDCPWNSGNKLLSVNVKAEDIEVSTKRNNLVFLIDVSGSMMGDDRLALVQETLYLLIDQIKDDDVISVVTYAGSDKVLLNGTSGKDKAKIRAVVEDLYASGSTNGSGAIQKAYSIAQANKIDGGNNQVILCTDGDFNVGISKPAELDKFISAKRDLGVNLSVFGYGIGNTSMSRMEDLAKHGNGVQYYIADQNDARSAMINGLNGLLNIVAYDAKASISFNTDTVARYRMIGFENYMLSAEDFEDENTDAGEIGAGHTVTAIFEITLREGVEATAGIATTTIRYKDEVGTAAADINHSITAAITQGNEDIQFIGCVVEFGLILRNSAYKGDATLDNIIGRLDALECVRVDEAKAEFRGLVVKYKALIGSRADN